MGKYQADKVHTRVDYVRYIYKNTDLFPNNFENFQFPVAVYSRDGEIAEANKYFRDIAGIASGDIRHEKVNIFDCLNKKSAGLIEAARNAFGGGESVYEGMRPLCAEPGTPAYKLIAKLPNAIFFPMACDCEKVTLAAILLDSKETDND